MSQLYQPLGPQTVLTVMVGLKELKNVDHLNNNNHAGYLILTKEEYVLISTQEYVTAEDVGEFFDIPLWAITETNQRNEKCKWTSKQGHRSTFINIATSHSHLQRCN